MPSLNKFYLLNYGKMILRWIAGFPKKKEVVKKIYAVNFTERTVEFQCFGHKVIYPLSHILWLNMQILDRLPDLEEWVKPSDYRIAEEKNS